MIRVMIVDNIRLMHDIVTAALDGEPDIEVVEHATTAEDARAKTQACDVVLVSSSLPESGVRGLIQMATQVTPSVKILMLGLPELTPTIPQYIEAGVFGYVPSEASPDELLEHIRAAYRGEAFMNGIIDTHPTGV